MNTEILTIITLIATVILGNMSKKSMFVSNNLIPLQNLLIGFIVAIWEWLITKDFSIALAVSGLFAGGAYDLFHNLYKIIKNLDNEKKEKVS